jgi:hypothetical protein
MESYQKNRFQGGGGVCPMAMTQGGYTGRPHVAVNLLMTGKPVLDGVWPMAREKNVAPALQR